MYAWVGGLVGGWVGVGCVHMHMYVCVYVSISI